MRSIRTFLILGGFLLVLAVLTACSSDAAAPTPSDGDLLLTAQAANPLPTQISGQGLSVVGTSACQVQKMVSVQTDKEQGEMISWSPSGNVLAYITPSNEKWGWFVGNLVILDVDKNNVLYTTSDIRVAGDLTWSPDGKKLAFVILDPQAKIYNVEILDLENKSLQQVFSSEEAKTDDWSSPKGIHEWIDSTIVEVMSSCDVDCSRSYDFNTATSQMTVGAEVRKQEDSSLSVNSEMTSPDGTWQLMIDTKDNTWMSSTKKHQASIILADTAVSEIKWSGDSSYLALKIDESVLLFEPVCKQK
jgi:WD40 repeat protein